MPTVSTTKRYRQIAHEQLAAFLARGVKPSLFFPHRIVFLPKCGPDGYKLAKKMCGVTDPDASWEIILYADSPHVDEFPDDIFFDDDLVWHQQQYGMRGQIATANVALRGDRLYAMVRLSDLVQRIGRRPEFRTRVEYRFHGWPHMLLNAVLAFAVERNVKEVYTATAEFALRHTDPARTPGRALFDRVYDWSVADMVSATRAGDWWVIDVEQNRDRIVMPVVGEVRGTREPVIAICHDIERGLGHVESDPSFAVAASQNAAANLDAMLSVEREADVRATYNVVGSILGDERQQIEAGGHAVAFHSYDHKSGEPQLGRCRDVDYRIKGYRLPQSAPTPDASDENLLFHNFEWLASSRFSFGFRAPRLERRLVKIPIAFDDYPLYTGAMAYDEWERHAFDEIRKAIDREGFVAFGMHDCYAPLWLNQYAGFLERVQTLGTLRTLNEVAADVTLRSAC